MPMQGRTENPWFPAFRVRLRKADYRLFEALAAAEGLPLATFARQAMLAHIATLPVPAVRADVPSAAIRAFPATKQTRANTGRAENAAALERIERQASQRSAAFTD